jgi:hypothetical protein
MITLCFLGIQPEYLTCPCLLVDIPPPVVNQGMRPIHTHLHIFHKFVMAISECGISQRYKTYR